MSSILTANTNFLEPMIFRINKRMIFCGARKIDSFVNINQDQRQDQL